MTDLISFYGSLRPDAYDRMAPAREGLVAHLGPCWIAGQLYDLGPFPGLIETGDSAHRVRGDLFRIISKKALPAFDDWEDYEPDDPEGSLYIRKQVRLIEPDVMSWLYVWNDSVEPYDHVPDGDWLTRSL